MILRSDDPVRDWDRYCDEQFKKRPICCECGETITGELCYEFDNEMICAECLSKNHRKWIADIVEW